MNIHVEIIPHDQQRYPTVGDWLFNDKGDLYVKVSALGNPDYETTVAVHEIIEAALCRKRGITAGIVDQFDKAFEANRAEGNDDEPGDDPLAPYKEEHFFATNIERLLSQEFGFDWHTYEAALNALP